MKNPSRLKVCLYTYPMIPLKELAVKAGLDKRLESTKQEVALFPPPTNPVQELTPHLGHT